MHILKTQVSRRDFFLRSGIGALIGGRILTTTSAEVAVQIELEKNEPLGLWVFDPVGVYIQPGQTIRWNNHKWGASVTAFHPGNENHELRIPEGVAPFDSGTMADEWNNTFEMRFDVEGTYDYFSRNQEVLGMVGRIIVGRPGGPGERPLGYGGRQGRTPMYKKAIRVFQYASSERIVKEKRLPFPQELFGRRY